MATTTFCDWCGELMELPEGTSIPLGVTARGDGGAGFIFQRSIAGFNIHGEEIARGELDPDCCLAKLEEMLRERAEWAHDPDQQSQEWRLVPREGRTPTARERRKAEDENRWERHDAWKRVPRNEREEMVRAQLADAPLTLRELAERLEAEFPDMAVYDSRLRPVVTGMFKGGELVREAEQYRAGPSVRYRYALASGEES